MSKRFDFFFETWAVTCAETLKLRRDPSDLLSRAVQPVLWLAIFGQVFSQVRGIPTGDLRYLDYMTPGILAQSVLFSAIFYGIAIIWERDLGIVHKLLVTPAHRSALVLGKALTAGLRGLVQTVVVYLVALALNVRINWEAVPMMVVAAAVFLGSCIFATFSLLMACVVKTRERFMGIGQVLTMPLFFASNALYPLALMPEWLQHIATLNPLTYLVDVLRGAMVVGGHHQFTSAHSFGIMMMVFIVLLCAASRLYAGLAR
jgi:ABC-2 type transport system permease protein